MKKFSTDQLLWYGALALVSAFLSGCFIMRDNPFAAICWALGSVCNIIMLACSCKN